MNKVKQISQMVNYNIKTLTSFELIFKLLSLIIFTPLFINCFNLIMKVTGYKYITFENVTSFLANPLTLILLLILVLFMMVYCMFEITTIIIILDCSYHKKKIKVIDAIRVSLNKCKNMFKFKNIMLAFLTLFIIPFLHIGINSSFISAINIPDYISAYIMQNSILLIIFCFIIFILVIILLRWLYAIHYYVLENDNFKEARRNSINLGRKNHHKDLIVLIITQAILYAIYFIFVALGILIIILFNKAFAGILIVKSLLTTIIWLFIALSFLIFTLLVTPISYAIISSLYYIRKSSNNEQIKALKINISKSKEKFNKIIKKAILAICILALITGTFFTYGVYKGKYNLNIEYIRTIEVTAHRGASILYPENTMSAFIGAKELGADWIELDLQQLKDGNIIIMHDENLKRITGLNKNTWEVTWDEIKDLDAGSFLAEKFKDERIPLFNEVISWAKDNNIRLNIELKLHGYETDFEKMVIDLINEYEYKDNCVITSSIYSVLENIKKYDDTIKTVYVTSIALGNITTLASANAFSIEASYVNKTLVNKIHEEGKEIYVWTVNNIETLNKMIDYNVDNIITDNIELTKETIYGSKTSDLVREYIKFIDNIF